jgi:hypothetical protein
MRRTAVLLASIAVALVWATTAAAQQTDPPGCNGTIFLSSSAGDTPGTEPKYTRGDTIYVNGTGFDANQAFTGYTVEDVNSGGAQILSGGAWSADASGSFTFSFSTSSGFTDDHEYKVTVYFTKEVGSEECQKSKNFFLQGEEETGGTTGGTPPTSGTGGVSGTTTGTGGVSGATTGGTTGGVAGAQAGGTLPFTGIPLWVPLFAGLGLLSCGYVLLRGKARSSA